ncbi:MAG: PilZ domain-containing protein [Chromatiales bacterium]|nr:PilZ domain-containing protein [Chromatiales bacterium]
MADTNVGGAERRIFARMRIGLEVRIDMKGSLVGRFHTRDLDLGGLFVEAGDIELYPNDVVDLAFFEIDGLSGDRMFRAKVVRHASDGVGLMFYEHDEDSLGALRDLMLEAMPAADAYATIAAGPMRFGA